MTKMFRKLLGTTPGRWCKRRGDTLALTSSRRHRP